MVNESTNTPAHEHTRAVRRAWLWLAIWIAVIVLESFAGSSENTGRILQPLLAWIFGPLPFLTFFKIHYWIRKLGHFTGYGILGFVAYRAWWTTFAARQISTCVARVCDPCGSRVGDPRHTILSWRAMLSRFDLRAAAQAVLVVLAVAGLDEVHQAFAPGRGSSFHDVILDTMGGILAQLIFLEIAEWRAAKKLKRPSPASPAPAAELRRSTPAPPRA